VAIHRFAQQRHCEAEGRGNPWVHALAEVLSFQHGLPRRFAPRSDVIARPKAVAIHRFAQQRHCEAEGRGNPWVHSLVEVLSFQHGLPRRFAPRSDVIASSKVVAIHTFAQRRHCEAEGRGNP